MREQDISIYKLGLISIEGKLIDRIQIVSYSNNDNLIRDRSRIIGYELYNLDILVDV